jgi:hypothetical protein
LSTDAADDEEALKKDLTMVIALHGLSVRPGRRRYELAESRPRCVVQEREQVSRLQ